MVPVGGNNRLTNVLPSPSPEKAVKEDEKRRYLDLILGSATDELIDEIVSEIVEKKILHYDFSRIIENERWFSIMDLRRIALKVSPDFEKPSKKPAVQAVEPEVQAVEPAVLKKKTKTRRS